MLIETLYNCNRLWEIRTQKNLLDDITIDSRINVEILKTVIFRECGECVVRDVYNRELQWFKYNIDSWFREREDIIRKLVDTTEFEYNPIHNFDRWEIRKRGEDKTGTETEGSARDVTTDGTNQHDVSAMNNPQLRTQYKDTNHSNSSDVYKNDVLRTDKLKEDEDTHAYGNIGVTSSQQLIEQERNVVLFNIYQKIAEWFEEQFCECIY